MKAFFRLIIISKALLGAMTFFIIQQIINSSGDCDYILDSGKIDS
ncbi:hypothetical protein HBN50_10010 [Halobacteriovorax sp. GB3]|nr:hypothetical protein [Halobacteriovorax sp. GB3]MDD0853434.1 hypothetical protein [Halobacteriovorax sp. GB3]